MANLVELETKRLRLRRWRQQDDNAFAAINADQRVMAFYPATLDRQQSRRQARAFALLMRQRGWGVWALELRDSAEFIGFVGLFERQPDKQLPFTPCVELVWRLAFAHWGQGLALEAARAAVDFAFARLAAEQLRAWTACQNSRSRALMARLGMDYEGDFSHPALPAEHDLCRHALYRLPRASWQDRQQDREPDNNAVDKRE